jgi:Methyltransferase domain
VHLCIRELIFLLPRRVRNSPVAAAACRTWGHDRLTLPLVAPEVAFPGFDATPVTVTVIPVHHWSSPLRDLVALTKIAVVTQPQRILELGSFEGHAALMLAANTSESTRITTVDILENHGAVYRDTPFADRITRHVGTIETLPDNGPFDLVFVDADHRREEVERDTRHVLERCRTGATVVWHDYCDTHWVNRINRVPEVLGEWAGRLPINALAGTSLAVCRVPRDPP